MMKGEQEEELFVNQENHVDIISETGRPPTELMAPANGGLATTPSMRPRKRQAHTLFDLADSTTQFDVEAVKLEHERQVWKDQTEDKRPSISSEESLSDYEEAAAISAGLEGEREARTDRVEGRSLIWEEREIEAALRSLCFTTYQREDAYSIMEMEDQHKVISAIQELVEPGKDLGPMLLCSAWSGKEMVVKHLLQTGVFPGYQDTEGRSPVHLAAVRDNQPVIAVLVEYKAPINVWDRCERASPLFCAAERENSACLPFLLSHGADPNMGLHEKGISALHCATTSNATRNMERLLAKGAETNSVVLFSETPLHIAASMGYSSALQILLDHGAGTEMLMGTMKMSALHLAAREGNVECVQLLLSAGANPRARNSRGQSPLHLAALAQSPETLELLLTKGGNPDCEDLDKRTPLHSAIVKGSRSYECVRLLLDARASVNHQDSFGYSPLHIAALNEYPYCANLLLSYGADITARTNGGTSALSMIVRKIPSVLPKFEDMLDDAITLAEHDINDVDCEIKLDYKVLIPNKNRGESGMFITFIETGHNHLLKHPLCESFLHLKWLKVRKFFFVSLSFHLMFTMLHTSFVMQVYSNQCVLKDNCKSGNVSNFTQLEEKEQWVSVKGDCFVPYEELCRITISTVVVWIFLVLSTLVLSGKEIFQLMHCQKLYFCNWENWVQWGIIVNVVMVSFHTNPLPFINEYHDLVQRWQHHAAAIGVFLVWGELMLMVGRLPTFGIYVQMFTTVAKNFFKFLTAYFCLLVAFGLSFCLLFPNYQSFNVMPLSALVKTLVMMAGEVEYEDFVYENGPSLFPFTGHFMIMLFVVLISIILMNLLVGLAVSDIQGLQKSAGLDRLVRQAELISHIESMLFTRLLHFLPVKFLDVLHQNALVVPHAYNWSFTIRPNDLREDRLSRDITESVHALVARRHQSKKRRPFSRYTPRGDRVRRNKSFVGDTEVGAAGAAIEDQLQEVKELVKSLQSHSNSVKRNVDILKANMELIISRGVREDSLPERSVTNLADKIHKSVKGMFLMQHQNQQPQPTTSSNNQMQQIVPLASVGSRGESSKTSVSDKEKVKDLVNNLTNLALAITEDRQLANTFGGHRSEEDSDLSHLEEEEDAPLVVPTQEAGASCPKAEDAADLQRYERKFGSLEKKLKRTNLMRRRESQALLDGLRKTRSGNSISGPQ